MDSVVFDGKEYTKASVVAEKFRYTQDYLGQLCRGKKVDARLVGRAWYVNVDSLNAHRDSRYKTTAAPEVVEIIPKKPSNNYLSRIDVEPILKKKTVKILKADRGTLSELPVKYESDDYALIPRVHKEAVSVSLPVNPAGAESLPIKKAGKTEATFVPEPLPEVYLRGTISVAGIPEPLESAIPEEIAEEKAEVAVTQVEQSKVTPRGVTAQGSQPSAKPLIRPKTVIVRPLRPVPSSSPRSIPATPPKAPVDGMVTHHVEAVPQKREEKTVLPVMEMQQKPPVQTPLPTSFTPALVVKKAEETVPPPSLFVRIVVPVSLILTAFMCGGLVLATSAEILATATSYNVRFVIQVANLSNLYAQLPW